MDSWMLLLDSAKVWEVGEEEKEEAGGWRKIREAGEPHKNSVGKKRRGGRKKEEERTFEAVAQVHFLAAGENPAEHPAKQQHLKFPPTMFRGGNLKDVAAAQGLAEQKGANFLKNRIFPRQSGKMGNRVCKSLPRLVFSFTRKKFEVEFSQAL